MEKHRIRKKQELINGVIQELTSGIFMETMTCGALTCRFHVLDATSILFSATWTVLSPNNKPLGCRLGGRGELGSHFCATFGIGDEVATYIFEFLFAWMVFL